MQPYFHFTMEIIKGTYSHNMFPVLIVASLLGNRCKRGLYSISVGKNAEAVGTATEMPGRPYNIPFF